MAGPLRLAALVAALLVPARADKVSGETMHCVMGRAHMMTYEVSGTPPENKGDDATLADLENAFVNVRPAAERDADCKRLSSQTPHCVGVNVDKTCQAAEETSVPLEFGADCEDCFGALSMDTYYSMNISWFKLQSLGLGFKNLRLLGGASLGKSLPEKLVKSGSVPMPGSGLKHTVLDVTLACPLCLHVKIYVELQSSLDWNMTDAILGDYRAGMTFEANLGNELVRYDAGKGWSMERFHHPTATMKPILGASGEAGSAIKASMPMNVRMGVSNIGWLQVGATPDFKGNLTVEGSTTPSDASLCFAAQGGMSAGSEAAIDIRLAGYRPQYRWSPRKFFSWESNETSKCKKLVGKKTTTKAPATVHV